MNFELGGGAQKNCGFILSTDVHLAVSYLSAEGGTPLLKGGVQAPERYRFHTIVRDVPPCHHGPQVSRLLCKALR